jgi:hypothetical protein
MPAPRRRDLRESRTLAASHAQRAVAYSLLATHARSRDDWSPGRTTEISFALVYSPAPLRTQVATSS